jgi:hypothetical protein
VPEVEAPEGSGCWCPVGCSFDCLGLVPEVEGVGEECGVLVVVEALEPVSGGDAGAGGGVGGATGGAVFVGVGAAPIVDGPKG